MVSEMSTWTEAQRRHYGRLFRFMLANQHAFRHPSAPVLTDEQWETTAHNAAWMAAEMLEPGDIEILDPDTDEFVATTKTAGLH